MIIIIFSLVSLLTIYIGSNVAYVGWRNYKSRKLFKSRASWLQIAPNSSLISGHLQNVISHNKNCEIMEKLHNKYGKTYGLYVGEEIWIATKDVDLIKHVIVDEARIHVNKSDSFYFLVKELNDSILHTKDDIWRRSRRVIVPTLSNYKICGEEISLDLNKLVNQLYSSIENRLDKAEEKSGKRSLVIDVENMAQRLSLAIIFLIGYNQDNMVSFDSEKDDLVDVFNEILHDDHKTLLNIAWLFPATRSTISSLIKFHRGLKYKEKIENLVLTTEKLARKDPCQLDKEKKLKKDEMTKSDMSCKVGVQNSSKKRMLDALLDAYHSRKIIRRDVFGNFWGMLAAGYITVADTLTCLMWHLAIQPVKQEKLRQSIFKEGIHGEYLLWCIYEAIRWHPPVPLFAGRKLKEDVIFQGKLYPAGAYINPTIPSIHRDECNWRDADKFEPERWSKKSEFHPAAFMGFGLGQRNCPGGKLAIQEMKLALQMLLMNYRFEKCEETVKEYNHSSHFLIFTLLEQPILLRLVAIS